MPNGRLKPDVGGHQLGWSRVPHRLGYCHGGDRQGDAARIPPFEVHNGAGESTVARATANAKCDTNAKVEQEPIERREIHVTAEDNRRHKTRVIKLIRLMTWAEESLIEKLMQIRVSYREYHGVCVRSTSTVSLERQALNPHLSVSNDVRCSFSACVSKLI